jgi:two-component system, sensor histidine kinase and response regulator
MKCADHADTGKVRAIGTFSKSDATILVVDDDPASLRLNEQLLTAAGYLNLRLYSDSRLALEELHDGTIDLVITDLHMPEIDGLEFLQKVKSSVPGDTFLPVLVVTADASPDARRRALMLGADDFLSKPIDVVEMTLRVQHMLQLRQLHIDLAASRASLEVEVAQRTQALEVALEQMENLVKAKDMFVASVSHELRTPLTAVLGFARELTNPERLSPEEYAETAEMIASQATDLSAIIDDLLVAARSDIDMVKVLDEPVDLWKELRTILDALPSEHQSRVSAPEFSMTVTGDRLRVRQILRNLVSNALRHGGDNITVSAERLPGAGAVTVSDDGPNLPEETVSRLFEPYFHASRDEVGPATIGLGLPVSRFLARLMDGELEYLTNRPDTAFRLSLPPA